MSYGNIARIYDAEYQHFDEDLSFYSQRLQEERRRGPLLELGCGTGRVALPLVKLGYCVTGVDCSEKMLRLARRHRQALAPEAALRIRFSLQDMRSFRFPRRFAAAIIAFSTFNLLSDKQGRQACLERLANHLLPGGLLLIDMVSPGQEPGDGLQRFESSFQLPVSAHLVHKVVEQQYDRQLLASKVHYHYSLRRYTDDRLMDQINVEFLLARIGRQEIEQALYRAGFDVEQVYGSYRGHPYHERSPRMLLQARLL